MFCLSDNRGEKIMSNKSIQSMEEAHDFFQQRRQLGIKPGLQRVEKLAGAVGNPEQLLNAVHIAGTNGKGSTVVFLKSILEQAGYRVGSFTSPPKETFLDMIEVGDQSITDTDFIDILQRLLPSIEQLDQQQDPPSEFEILTVIAFVHLQASADIAIIEVAMGGREDTTNILTPLVSVVTTIGLDHQRFLGDTYQAIAYHKAGIIKKDTPVIVGRVPACTRETFITEAERQTAPLIWLEQQLSVDQYVPLDRIDQVQLTMGSDRLTFTKQIVGEHQVDNAALAVAACQQLKEHGFTIGKAHMEIGLSNAFISGRFEQVMSHPLIIIDSAHNHESIQAFCRTVSQRDNSKSPKVLFAVFKDKPITAMMTCLARQFDEILCTTFDHPRAAKTEEIALSFPKVQTVDWKTFLLSLAPMDRLYVTGSVEFVTQVRKYLLNHSPAKND